jgi:mannitol 2-dehydrogenase
MCNQKMTQAIRLSNRTLGQLRGRVDVPRYDRRGVTPGIVHIGVGGFNRSHLAVFLDDLLVLDAQQAAQKDDKRCRWGEFGVGLLAGDSEIHEALVEQDYLYGVLERDAEIQNYRVIGSLVGHHYGPESPEAVVMQLASPECGIISLTVTEGGYFLNDTTAEFRVNDPAIHRDLEHPARPTTWLGYVAAAVEHRMREGQRPFTLMSCDNLQSNGDAARRALLAFAELRDRNTHGGRIESGGALRDWIEANVTFPNSMVDRITPRTTEADREFIAEKFGVRDRIPVVTEPFRQWVLEDKFCAGRPDWERVGVTMSADVAQYEKTKMRLLNGGHFCIAYCAAMLEIATVSDALSDPQLHELLRQFLDEVRETLVDLPGIDLKRYTTSVMERFGNPAIRDQIERICADGPAKVTKFILPSLEDLARARKKPRILPLVIASWLEYEHRAAKAVEKQVAERDAEDLGAMREVAIRVPEFVATIKREQESLRALGVRAALTRAFAQTEGSERSA